MSRCKGEQVGVRFIVVDKVDMGMKQKMYLAIAMLLCFFLMIGKAEANPITKQQAQKNVQSFLEKKGKKFTTGIKDADPTSKDVSDSYYIFNVGNNEGFVVAAGDDCVPAILGYADEGNIIIEAIPDNMKSWLQGYADQIAYMKANDLTYRGEIKTNHTTISPLLTTNWGQDDPYNQQCPDFFDFGKSVTGCVATAMAQVMYYHHATSTNQTLAEIPAYQCRTNWNGYGQISVAAVPAGSTIDWDNMIDNYSSASTEVQKTAVANLMAYCGASVEMNYSNGDNGGSGATSAAVPVALKKYFGYSKDTYLEYRDNYSDEEWDNLIYNELSKGNPVYYSGSNNSGGGHAFVCDGYAGDGYYHINWGWQGMSDGNFLLSVLDPDVQGTGGSDAGYNLGQDALIGAVPRDLTIIEPEAYAVFDNGVLTFYCDNNRATRTGTTYDLNSGSNYPGWNFDYIAESNSYNYAKAANIAKVVFDQSFSSATPSTTYSWFSYCSNLAKIEGLEYLNTKYVENMARMFMLCSKLSNIDLSTFDTSNVGDYQNMFVYCTGLKSVDISHFVTRKMWTMYHMFRNCTNLMDIKLPNDLKMISESQFQDCSSLALITIPAGVKQIDNNAFMNSGLETVISYMEAPCAIDESVFSGISSNAILYVPLGSKSAYETADNWKSFYEIVEIDADLDIEVILDNDLYMNAGDRAVMTLTQFESLILAQLNGGAGMTKADFEANYRFLDEGEHGDMPTSANGALYETAASNSFWGQRFYSSVNGTVRQAANSDNENDAVNKYGHYRWTADNNWFGRVWYNPEESTGTLIWDLHGYIETVGNISSYGNMKDAPGIPNLFSQLLKVSGASYDSKGLSTRDISTVVRFVNKTTGNFINVRLIIPVGKIHFEYGAVANKDWAQWYQFNTSEVGGSDASWPYSKEFDTHVNLYDPDNRDCAFLQTTSLSQNLADYWLNPATMIALYGNRTYFSKFYSSASFDLSFSFTTPVNGINSKDVSANKGQWNVTGASGTIWTLQLAAHNGVDNTAIVAVKKNDVAYGPEEICYLDGTFEKNGVEILRNNYIHYHGLETTGNLYPAATDVLNKMGAYDDQGNTNSPYFLEDNIDRAFTAYLKVNVSNDDLYDPLISKNYFNVRYQRPINIAAKNYIWGEQAVADNRIAIKDLVEIIDWNNVPVVAGNSASLNASNSIFGVDQPSYTDVYNDATSMKQQNLGVPFEYYGISELAVRYDEIRTDYGKTAETRGNVFSSEADITANTDLAKSVAFLNGSAESGLKALSLINADGTAVSFTSAHAYNHSDLNASGDGTNYGWLYYNGSATEPFHIYVPIAVKYNWGSIAYDDQLDAAGTKLDDDYTQTVWAVITVNAVEEEKQIYLNDVAARRGTQAILPIQLDNNQTVSGFQFEVTLPEGIEYVECESTSRVDKFTISTELLSGNTIAFIGVSMSGDEIPANSGDLLNLVINIPEDYEPGEYVVTLSNISWAHNEGNETLSLSQGDVNSKLVVEDYKLGDANGDTKVNVSDVVIIVNYILKRNPAKFVFKAADVVRDNKINVADVVGTVNIILKRNVGSSARMRYSDIDEYCDKLNLSRNEDNTYSLYLDNQNHYVAAQFDVQLSAGQVLNDISLNGMRSENHLLSYEKLFGDTYRVVIYSLSNENLKEQEGELITIKTFNGCNSLSIKNIKFITNLQTIKEFPSINIGATGIESLGQFPAADIYTIDGRLVRKKAVTTDGLNKGIYIINNKKTIVK